VLLRCARLWARRSRASDEICTGRIRQASGEGKACIFKVRCVHIWGPTIRGCEVSALGDWTVRDAIWGPKGVGRSKRLFRREMSNLVKLVIDDVGKISDFVIYGGREDSQQVAHRACSCALTACANKLLQIVELM
jgi:hypothetical protein